MFSACCTLIVMAKMYYFKNHWLLRHYCATQKIFLFLLSRVKIIEVFKTNTKTLALYICLQEFFNDVNFAGCYVQTHNITIIFCVQIKYVQRLNIYCIIIYILSSFKSYFGYYSVLGTFTFLTISF